MVGLPGSGKSTYVRLNFDKSYLVLSSDQIRKELLGDEGSQANNRLVFDTLYSRMVDALKNGKNVVVDATNINALTRSWTLEKVENMNIQRVAVVLETPIETCLKRDQLRKRHVEKEVIEKCAAEFEIPTSAEGFDKIKIVKNYHI